MSMELEDNRNSLSTMELARQRELMLSLARRVLDNDVSDALDGVDDKYYALFLPSLDEQSDAERKGTVV